MLKKALAPIRSLLFVTLLTVPAFFYSAATPAYAAIHPQVMTSFSAPGGQVRGLAWGDNSLWLADDQTIYRLGAGGALQASYPITYSVTDMAWFENSLWVYADGGGVYKLNEALQISETLSVSYWCCHAMEWAQGDLYVTDFNAGSVHKHNRAGQPLVSWSFSPYMHPEGMTYAGGSLWIGDSSSRVVYRYSVTGTLQDQVDLSVLENCDYTCSTTLAWDGRYLWYAGKNTIYQLDITGPFADANAGLAGVSNSAAAWGDYDGDGRLDVAVIGSAGAAPLTKIYRNDGNQVFTEIPASLPNLTRGSVDWGDYDNDSRLDLLLMGCGDAACSARVTRVYRNLGNGAFANVVSAGLPGVADGQAAWGDYNNDGRLDILLLGHNGSTGVTRIFRNNGNGTFTDIQQLNGYNAQMTHIYHNAGNGDFTDSAASLKDVVSGSAAWGDYDRDGRLDLLLTGSGVANIYHNEGAAPNTAPSTPNNLQAACSAQDCTLTWMAPADDHTPANGLTFNVRVGTTPGGGEVVTPMALTNSGYRLVPRMGNAGERLSFYLQGLAPNTTYYWSVQAIDTASAGSPFSTESTFASGALTYAFLPMVVKAAPPAANPPWTGMTSAGYPVSFEVSPNGQQWSNFKLKIGFQLGACSGTAETIFSGPGSITNNQFTYSGPWSFSGQLTSLTSASGTYSIVNYYVASCGSYLSQSGTWTASRP